MNFIGKFCVMLYGTTSLFCLILATAVFTQNMNFVTPKGEDTRKLPPLVQQSIDKTKQLIAANNSAYTRLLQNYEGAPKTEDSQKIDGVVEVEAELALRRDFYEGQLDLAQTGELNGKKIDNPIQIIVHDPAALKQTPPARIVLIDKPGDREPVRVPPGQKDAEGKPSGAAAKTPHFYVVESDKADLEKAKLQAQTDEKVGELLATSLDINGTDNLKGFVTAMVKEKKLALPPDYVLSAEKEDALITKLLAALAAKGIKDRFKGLHVRTEEQEDIAKFAIDETKYLETPITTRRAELEIFEKRKPPLESRIANLIRKGYGKKEGGQAN